MSNSTDSARTISRASRPAASVLHGRANDGAELDRYRRSGDALGQVERFLDLADLRSLQLSGAGCDLGMSVAAHARTATLANFALPSSS